MGKGRTIIRHMNKDSGKSPVICLTAVEKVLLGGLFKKFEMQGTRQFRRTAELDASPEGMTRPEGEGHGRPESNPEDGVHRSTSQ